MAAPFELQPMYDTSPSNPTPSSFLQIPRSLHATPVANNAVEASSSSTKQPSCFHGFPKALGANTRHTGDNANKGDSSLCVGAQVMPEEAYGLNTYNSESANTINSIVKQIHSCDSPDRKSTAPVTKLKINSPFSLNTMHDLFMHFDSEKRGLLDSIGLGGLLKVHKQRLQCRNLLLSLLSSMDPNTGTLALKSGELSLKDRDVNLVLGIPYTGEDVNLFSKCPGVIDKVKAVLLLNTDGDITLDVLHGILIRDYGRKMNRQERDAFKVAAMLFVDSCFLGPRGCKRRINKDILKHVADPLNISKTNWSGYVIRVLKQSACKVQQNLRVGNKSVLLEGCLLFLLVFYLDNLNFGYMTPRHDILPRVAKYTPCLVSELVSYDRLSSGTQKTLQYGRSKLRARAEVVYSRHVTVVPNESRNGSNQNLHTPVRSSEQHMEQSKVDGHFEMFEAVEAFNEYLQVFRNQIQQSTDELERKVQFLLNKFHHDVCSSSLSTKGSYDAKKDIEHHNRTTSKLGLKAPSRKYYMTVQSSSMTTPNNHSPIEICNIDMYTLAHDNSPLGGGINCTTSHHMAPSSVLINEDSGHESMPHLNSPTKIGLFDHGSHYRAHHLLAPSPFVLELKHKDVPLKTILEVIRLLSKLCDNDKNMDWYIHEVPSKLVIGGESLYLAFYKEIDFSPMIMNAVIRLYKELDDEMYQGSYENRWRHYLPADWATHVLMAEQWDGKNIVNDYFFGDHINYKVDNCKMVLVPVYNDSHWSLYAWDFSTKRITIMDSVTKSMDIICGKHDSTVTRLHDAMLSCIQQIFGCSHTPNPNWDWIYLTEKDVSSSMSKSGLYTAFYARFFDGAMCTRSMLMEDSVTLFQTSLLCQLLGSMTNKGTYPHAIRVALAETV